MPQRIDISNQRFGKLIAIKPVASKNKHTYWLCQCDCGNLKEIQTSHLTCGAIKSCGCQQSIGNDNYNKNFIMKEQICPICQKTFINKQNNRHYCYECIPEGISSAERQYYKNKAFKHFLVQYKGGKCELCGYNKCEGALEFHHKNPEEKEIEISKNNYNYNTDINIYLKEVDKCMLLCANCHREQHYLKEAP